MVQSQQLSCDAASNPLAVTCANNIRNTEGGPQSGWGGGRGDINQGGAHRRGDVTGIQGWMPSSHVRACRAVLEGKKGAEGYTMGQHKPKVMTGQLNNAIF